MAEAARILAVSPSTVWRWIQSEKLPAYRMGERTIRIRQDDLEAMMRPARGRFSDAERAVSAALIPHLPPQQLAQRRAAVTQLLANRQHRSIAPLTTAELVQRARKEGQRTNAERRRAGGGRIRRRKVDAD